jgi:hypothetical protein
VGEEEMNHAMKTLIIDGVDVLAAGFLMYSLLDLFGVMDGPLFDWNSKTRALDDLRNIFLLGGYCAFWVWRETRRRPDVTRWN